MPVDLSYLASNPQPPNPFAPAGSITPFLPGSFLEGCDLNFNDQDYFLRVLDRSFSLDYVASLQAAPDRGYEQFQGHSKVAERVSIAINRLDCCAFLITAEGGQKATGTVEFIRDTGGPALTIARGTVVTTVSGRDFVVTQDVNIVEFSSGPFAVPVEAVAFGYEYNVPGRVVAKNGELLEGEIRFIKCMVTIPVDLDESMAVRQIVPTEGGRPACLDGLANDYGVTRSPLESDDAFRLRVQETPDTVSPNAICRGINRLLKARDPTFECCLREVGRPLLPGIFYDAGSSFDSPQVPANNYAYDMEPDNRPEDRFKFYLDTVEMRRFMLIGVPNIVDVQDFGMAYDGSDLDTFPLQNAYDDTTLDNNDTAYDGFPIFSGSFHKSISDLVQDKKAAGVRFDLYIEDEGCF